jgi:hypothetical protein
MKATSLWFKEIEYHFEENTQSNDLMESIIRESTMADLTRDSIPLNASEQSEGSND